MARFGLDWKSVTDEWTVTYGGSIAVDIADLPREFLLDDERIARTLHQAFVRLQQRVLREESAMLVKFKHLKCRPSQFRFDKAKPSSGVTM